MKENKIKVSIVMPVLNGMPYFPKAMESILHQTLKEIEILVVDAGSTDGTSEYVTQVAQMDARVRLFFADKKSMGYQYNLGIQNARGVYVGFCESDDYMDTSAYEKMYLTAVENEHPDAIKSDFYFFIMKDEEEISLYYSTFLSKQKNLYGKTINTRNCPTLFFRDVNIWNGIYKREFLEKNNILLNESQGAAFQDAGFILQVHMTAEKEYYLKQAYYHYRKDNEGSSVYKKEIYKFAIWELEYMMCWFERNEQYTKLWAHTVFERLFGLFADLYGKYYMKNGETKCSDVLELQSRLKCFVKTHGCSLQSELQKFWHFTLFLENVELFSKIVTQEIKNNIQDCLYFKNNIDQYKYSVIFGCGESGQVLLTILLKNGYKGEISFCDNNQEKWNGRVMGYPVISVEKACEEWENTCFLLPGSSLYWKEMKIQLWENGVDTENILVAPCFAPHSAMEIDWNY